MRLGLVAACALFAACGRVGFDPVSSDASVDATVMRDADPAGAPLVQTGTIVVGIPETGADVPIGNIDLAHSVLVFSVAVDARTADDALFLGELLDTGVAHFEREGTSVVATISYSVITWSGWNVQRGRKRLAVDQTLATASFTPVVLEHSFPLLTRMVQGGNVDDDDQLRISFQTNREIGVNLDNGNPNPVTIAWQVVEIPSAEVIAGTSTLMTGDVGIMQLTSPYADGSFLVHSQSVGNASTSSSLQLRGTLIPPSTVTFDRFKGDGTVQVQWYVVQLAAGVVERGSLPFGVMVASQSVSVAPRESAAFVFTQGGRSSRDNDGNPGAGTATMELDATTLQVTRALQGNTADIPWQVIELER